MPRRLRGWAPAKINLVLEVLGRRPDGYHEIDTILHTLDLAGTVDLELESARPGVTVAGPFAEGVPADQTNLAWLVAAELARRTGNEVEALSITLDKQVPAAGGLGGGRPTPPPRSASFNAPGTRLRTPWWRARLPSAVMRRFSLPAALRGRKGAVSQ